MRTSPRFPVLVALGLALAACPAEVKQPRAVAAAPASAIVGAPVQLDGSQSSDPQGRALSYQWTMLAVPAGSSAQLGNPSSMAPSFVPDLPGKYLARLVVSNGILSSDPATAAVTVADCGASPPVAVAGVSSPLQVPGNPAAPSTTVAVPSGATVQVDGSASYDPNAACGVARTLGYSWALTALPAGSQARLNSSTVVNPSFTADQDGDYVLALTVSAGALASQPATVTVTASSAASVVDVATGPFSALALDPSGNPVVAYLDNVNGLVEVARCTANCTGSSPTWSRLPVVDTGIGSMNLAMGSASEPRPIDVQVTGGGQVYVAYHHQGACAVKVATCDLAGCGAWALTTVESGSGCGGRGTGGTDYGRWVSLSLTPAGLTGVAAGLPALAYYRYEANFGGSGVPAGNDRYAVCTAGCTAAASTYSIVDVQAPSAGLRQGRWPSLRLLGPSGSLAGGLAFYQEDAGSLAYAECSGASCLTWGGAGVVDSGGAAGDDVGRWASLAVDASGHPRIAYRDDTAGWLEYAACDATCAGGESHWSHEVADGAADVGLYASLAIDGGARPHVAYRDSTDRALKHAFLDAAGAFATQFLDTSSDVGYYCSLALSASGSPRVSYYDNTTGDVKFYGYGP